MLDANALSQLATLKNTIHEDKELLTGTVRGTPNRYGFVVTDDDGRHFLPPDEMKRVLPGDRVEFSLQMNGDRQQAAIETLVESEFSTFVGRVVDTGKNRLVAADHPGLGRWLGLTRKSADDAKPDTWVRCRLKRHPIDDGRALAEVTAELGDDSTPYLEHKVAKARFNLTPEFPESVLQAAQALDFSARLDAQTDYEDATDLPLVTIDSASTQDMDDAFCVEADGDHWALTVAIADPTLFVDSGSVIDREALLRNCSRYLPAETLHMLPPVIAVEQCSLRAGVIRPALLMRTRVDRATGEAEPAQFSFGRVRSRAKLAYRDVSAFLGGATDAVDSPEIQALLQQLDELTEILNRYRQQHCIVMPDRPDYRLRLDERGHIDRIEEDPRNRANLMVEEIMLLTNRLAAQHLKSHQAGLFLCHDGFRDDQTETITKLLQVALADQPSTVSDFATMLPILQQAQNHESLPLAKLLAKSYQRVNLSPDPKPHWGLGFEAYTTITSPIRKYLDLLMHRQIKAIWRGETVPHLAAADMEKLQADQGLARAPSNYTETWLKAIYLKPREGEQFKGTVQHITRNGFSVMLEGLGTSGFINLKGWQDNSAEFDPVRLEHHTKHGTFRLEMPITVVLRSVDLERKNIQLDYAGPG